MSASNSDRPLLIVTGEATSDQYQLSKDDVVIGRDEDCDIVIQDRQVSRRHVRIYKEDDAYFVEDLESRNGTWVNGEQLKGCRRLYDNDVIQLAATTRMQFLGSGATAPMPYAVPANLADGRLRLDRESRRVFIKGQELNPPLSPPQYRLLELLYLNVGRICTRDQVIEAVWPDVVTEGVSEQAVDALVRRLRDRLAELDPEWQYVITVRGHGFRLDMG
ncbi:MAG: FHA domain-containing protein [Anaerolinea sp.]|nr:FHA domain-containing protein [Anaerolinea sp.]